MFRIRLAQPKSIEQPIILPEDTIPPNFTYKTNSFTDQAHFRQHMKRNRTGEVGRPARA